MINEISYVHDKVIIADNEAQMQKMISKINHAGLKYQMKINFSEKKVMKFSRTNDNGITVNIDGQGIENVKEFCHLSIRISNDRRNQKKIAYRIGIARKAFHNLSST